MSPWSIVVETLRVTLKPLSRIAIVMAVIMLLPDSGSAAQPRPATGLERPAVAAAIRSAADDMLPLASRAQPNPVSTITVDVDLGRLPASAFGDHDTAR